MEYSHLLDLADDCEDPYMRLVYACKCSICVCVCVCARACAFYGVELMVLHCSMFFYNDLLCLPTNLEAI